MGRADVDVGLGRHPCVDRMGSGEIVEAILPGNHPCITEILDQLQRMAERQDLHFRNILNEVGKLLHVAVILDAVAIGIFRRILARQHGDAEALHRSSTKARRR